MNTCYPKQHMKGHLFVIYLAAVLLSKYCAVIIWSKWVDYAEFCINKVSFTSFTCNL